MLDPGRLNYILQNMQRFKSIILLLIPLLLSKMSEAQPKYYVSHVQGLIQRFNNDKVLAVGDTVNPLEKLYFKSKTDFITLISSMNGSRTVSGRLAVSESPGKGFLAVVKDLVLPTTSIGTLAIRSGNINNLLDFENYCKNFSDTIRLLIAGSRKVMLNPLGFPDRYTHFFYIEYPYQNEIINKKLLFQEPSRQSDSLFLLLGGYLYELDGKAIERNRPDSVKMYYYNSVEKKSTFLSYIRLNYLSIATLLKELQVVKTVLADKHESDTKIPDRIRSELREYITTNYGLIDDSTFISLLIQLKMG